MEAGIFNWFGFKHPYREIITLIKEAGFQSVMIWWGDETDDYTVPKHKQPETVRKAGLKLDSAHLEFANVNKMWEDSLDGEEIFKRYCFLLDECKDHEIPTAVMHATTGKEAPPYSQPGLDRFKGLMEKAERNGINIALENVRNPEYIDRLFSDIESDRLKFCYDCGHENCYSPDIDFLAKYGDRLIALHLHDNDGAHDQHLLPFNGTVNWKRIMTELKKLEYNGPLALEIDAQFKDMTKEFTASQYLSEAMSRIALLNGLL